jgi:hypothetical protein
MMAPGADGALRFAAALNAVFRQTLLIWPV